MCLGWYAASPEVSKLPVVLSPVARVALSLGPKPCPPSSWPQCFTPARPPVQLFYTLAINHFPGLPTSWHPRTEAVSVPKPASCYVLTLDS